MAVLNKGKRLPRCIEAVQLSPDELTDYQVKLLTDIKELLGFVPKVSDTEFEFPYESTIEICRHFGSPELDSFARNGSLRRRLIALSYFRPDRLRTPPVCMFCLNSDPEQTTLLGALRWSPQFPLFFAFHELCVTEAPRTVVRRDGSNNELEKILFGMDLQSVIDELKRAKGGNTKKRPQFLSCAVCKMSGALQGCYKKRGRHCMNTYHLPCALRDGAFVSYEANKQYLLCSSSRCPDHSSAWLARQKSTLNFLYDYTGTSVKSMLLDSPCGVYYSQCTLCGQDVAYDYGQSNLGQLVVTACCHLSIYHSSCMQKRQLRNAYCERRCPKCKDSNVVTNFPQQLKLQGIYANHVSHDYGDREISDSPFQTRCVYANDHKCQCPYGPYYYDVNNLDNSQIALPWEPLNECTRCSRTCHRKCAGSVWAQWIDQPDEDDEESVEPIWMCDLCDHTKTKRASLKSHGPMACADPNKENQMGDRKVIVTGSLGDRKTALDDISTSSGHGLVDESRLMKQPPADNISAQPLPALRTDAQCTLSLRADQLPISNDGQPSPSMATDQTPVQSTETSESNCAVSAHVEESNSSRPCFQSTGTKRRSDSGAIYGSNDPKRRSLPPHPSPLIAASSLLTPDAHSGDSHGPLTSTPSKSPTVSSVPLATPTRSTPDVSSVRIDKLLPKMECVTPRAPNNSQFHTFEPAGLSGRDPTPPLPSGRGPPSPSMDTSPQPLSSHTNNGNICISDLDVKPHLFSSSGGEGLGDHAYIPRFPPYDPTNQLLVLEALSHHMHTMRAEILERVPVEQRPEIMKRIDDMMNPANFPI